MNNIYATFTDPDMAQKAAGALLDHGVKAEHLSVIFPEGYSPRSESGKVDGSHMQDTAEKGITTTTAGDAGAGAAKGAGLGLLAGSLAALAAIFVPGVGLVVGGGALAMALGGAAATTAAGAVAGGVTGYLKDQGVPDNQLQTYNEVLGRGGAMITVTPGDEKLDLAEIESVITKYSGSVASYSSRAQLL